MSKITKKLECKSCDIRLTIIVNHDSDYEEVDIIYCPCCSVEIEDDENYGEDEIST